MKRDSKRGEMVYRAWIPEKFAKLNKFIKLKFYDSVEDLHFWDDGWKIKFVGQIRRDEKEAIERNQDYKRMKKATDI